MKSRDIEILAEVFSSVLERESFMFAAPMDKSEVVSSSEMFEADISFSGENVAGNLSLVLPKPLTLELAGNMLGAEPEEEFVQEQASDALGELLNVLCGQFLTTVEGEVPIFDLGVPVVTPLTNDQWQELLRQEFTSVLMVEDEYNVLLKLKLEQ